MTEIVLQNVAKSFGALSVLQDISLEIEDGEFLVLVGPSGCGKSTLLRTIAGLEDLTDGVIAMGGEVVNRVPAKKRDLAMVFQSYALYPHMNVAKNMSFALRLARKSNEEIDKRVREAAEILDIEGLLERLPRELSGGQRQRVAMGRAIVRNPAAFLFDEPLSNLDAKLRVKMRAEIKDLHRRLGKTMIYVTHDQTEAMTLADRIVVLNKGTIAQVGRPMDLFYDPVDTFVAGFIGSPEINLLNAHTLGSGETEVQLSDGVRLPLAHPLDMPVGTKIIYGVRPQHIEIGEPGIEGEIELVEPTGEEQFLIVAVGNNKFSMVAYNKGLFHIGDKICFQPAKDKVLLFDFETGAQLA